MLSQKKPYPMIPSFSKTVKTDLFVGPIAGSSAGKAASRHAGDVKNLADIVLESIARPRQPDDNFV